jgi:protein-S-isoprenylcysteine O-methyltransferase Ste14
VTYAVAAGIALGVATIGGWPAIAAGMGLLCAVSVVYAVLDRRIACRRGKILDERALGAHAARFFPMYFIVFAAAMFHPGDDWQPWYSIGVGTIVALSGFVYLRLEDRYQARRLTAGDYDRYDLL